MPDDAVVEAAVLAVAEHLSQAFDLPEWNVTRQGGESAGTWIGPELRSEKYVGRDGSTPEDFEREVEAAFRAAGLRVVEAPGIGNGGWLVGTADLGGARLTVRSKGAIEIMVV